MAVFITEYVQILLVHSGGSILSQYRGVVAAIAALSKCSIEAASCVFLSSTKCCSFDLSKSSLEQLRSLFTATIDVGFED
jgi:hypothetical protein